MASEWDRRAAFIPAPCTKNQDMIQADPGDQCPRSLDPPLERWVHDCCPGQVLCSGQVMTAEVKGRHLGKAELQGLKSLEFLICFFRKKPFTHDQEVVMSCAHGHKVNS